MFISTSTGMVSATERPPAAAACSLAASWVRYRSGSAASTVRTFQFSGRRAASVMSAMSSTSSGRKPRRQPSVTYSRVVPSWPRTAPQRASTSSRLAHRDATGSPSPSEWVNDKVVENPSPPASSASWSSGTIAATWASSASWPTASAPITLRRTAQCPTRNPTLIPTWPSSRSR